MIRPIMKDVMFLNRKSENAVPADIHIADDLRDTLKAHSESCVGMAANMIGVNKRIIVINVGIHRNVQSGNIEAVNALRN